MKDFELINAFREMLNAIVDYKEYEYSGDPYEEDRRAMKEMDIDDISSERIDRYKIILAKCEDKK